MIIAVDFDGVLCVNEFPAIGDPNYQVISMVREFIDMGHEVILWSSRTDAELTAAVDWCNDRGLHFSAVNENALSNIEQYKIKYPNGTRKVYADFYIDDHSPEFLIACMNHTYEYAINCMCKNARKAVKLWQEG